jgi:iron complex outermembrane receptor protein
MSDEPLSAFGSAAAVDRRTAVGRVRSRPHDHPAIWPLAVAFVFAVLVPAPGQTQDSSPQPAESTQAPKPDGEQSAPATEPSPPSAPAPSTVRVPEVVVSAPRPKRVAIESGPRPTAAPRRPIAAAAPRPAAPPPSVAPSEGTAASAAGPGALPKPPGQTITTVSGERLKDAPAFTVEELLQESPGVSFKQGNGPRDIGISIRGSNARNTFGIRNIVVLEDGFPVTQPDGLSRTDLLDPHAYGGVDVYRGPASAMFGNYATGGAINFRLWRGEQINGARYGVEAVSDT